MPEKKPDPLLAVVDLGSNSFRLEIGRVEGDQIYQLDTWRETLRFGAGLDDKGRLKRGAMEAALACLARFRERLSGLHPSAVRVVATNTFRVAKNAREFLAVAERTLGLPIDVISGHEEARLTFFGVAHELPPSARRRLVIDIGGGSTEFIIGRGLEPERLESLAIGCVGMTQRYFRDGTITAAALDAAETVGACGNRGDRRRVRAGPLAGSLRFVRHVGRARRHPGAQRLLGGRHHAGRARAPAPPHDRGRTRVASSSSKRSKANARRCWPAGCAIMSAAVAELRIERIDPVGGALRLGVLYDLLGRTIDEDARAATVERFIVRYGIDRVQALRVGDLAAALYRRAVDTPDATLAKLVEWAGRLHEVGMSISHDGFHKHGAYILQNADMPGFSAGEQSRLAFLVFACRGGLAKVAGHLDRKDVRAAVLAVRIAVIVHHARAAIAMPRITMKVAREHPVRHFATLARRASADRLPAREGESTVGGARPALARGVTVAPRGSTR